MNSAEFKKTGSNRPPLTIRELLDILRALVDNKVSLDVLVNVEGCDCTDFARGVRLGPGADENDVIQENQLTILADGKQYESGLFFSSAAEVRSSTK